MSDHARLAAVLDEHRHITAEERRAALNVGRTRQLPGCSCGHVGALNTPGWHPQHLAGHLIAAGVTMPAPETEDCTDE